MTYNWAQLTSEAMTNLFLYGDITTPENLVSDALLRPLDRELVIDIDAVSYMGTGPGRFIDPRNFEPIARFFSDAGRADLEVWFANNPSVSSKTFSLEELQSEFGWSIKKNAGIQQADYVTTPDDEVYRAYVWGSSAFELQNTQNLEFVVDSAGGQLTLHVNGINIAPRNDNFDFQSSSFEAGLTGQVSQSILDPSAIGRTVVFNYVNEQSLPTINGWTPTTPLPPLNPLSQSVKLAVFDLEKELFEDVASFLDAQDRPILYGTVESDKISADFHFSDARMLHPYEDNGAVLIAGAGDDTLVGGAFGDELRAGDGDDKLVMVSGGAVTDHLYGGAGADTFVLFSLSAGGDTQEFVIEDADATDVLAVPLILFNSPLAQALHDQYGPYKHTGPLLQLVGGITTSVGTPDGGTTTESLFQWVRSTDVVETGPEDWPGDHYLDQSIGAIPFYGHIVYEEDGDDLVIRLFYGEQSDWTTTTWVDGEAVRNEHFRGIAVDLDTETVIRVKNFTDGMLGITYERDPGNSIEESDAVIDEVTSGLVGAGFSYGENWPPYWATEPELGNTKSWNEFWQAIGGRAVFKVFWEEILGTYLTLSPAWQLLTTHSLPSFDGVVLGTARSDTLTGASTAQQLLAGSGDDYISGEGGADSIDGGAGSDFVNFSWSNSARTITLGEGSSAGSATGGVTLVSIENVLGTEYSDTITGNSQSNALVSGVGDDVLLGLGGEDLLIGGIGNDVLSGGAGGDRYYYSKGDGNDTIDDSGVASEADVLEFIGLVASDLTFVRNGPDLLINLSNGDQITVVDQFLGKGLEGIVLGDGGTLTRAQFQALTGAWSNTAPTLAVPLSDVSMAEDDVKSFALPEGAFVDADGSPLLLSAELANGQPLPSWLRFNAETKSFIATPPDNYSGTIAIRVTGSDGAASVSDVFDLVINGANDAPTAIVLSNTAIDEGSANGTLIGTLTGSDPESDALTFSLLNDAGGRFSLTGGNSLVVNNGSAIDSDQQTSHIVTVKATDANGASTSRNITITVIDVNFAPTAISLSASEIQEGAVANSVVGLLSSTDADAGDTPTYTLVDSAGGRFQIVGNELRVSNGLLLDYEQASSHTVTVRATDTAGAFTEQSILITVTDVSPESITGDNGNNYLVGGSSNDQLDGGGGNDTLVGGAGNDTYVVDVLGDVVVENFNGGDDVVRVAGASYVLAANVYVETLEAAVLTGTTALNLTGNDFGVSIKGNDGNNLLTGGSGSDLINGRAGTDSLVGGAGNDFYWTDGGDTITETLNAGTDTVYSTVNYVLGTGSNLENLTLFGVATTATGNELDNKLTGNDLANTLTGGAGNDQLDGGLAADTLDGGAGDDWYFVNTASDIVRETTTGGTADRVFASASYTLSNDATFGFVEILSTNDVNGTAAINLTGNTRANQIIGNAGNNIIAGWQGQDTLTGGAGSDTFDFNAIADSTVGTTRDRITDFVHLVDKIDLSTIDANTTIAGNQAFSSALLNSSGTGAAGRIKVYEQGGVATIVEAFVNADSVADFQIQIAGIGLGLTSADFVL